MIPEVIFFDKDGTLIDFDAFWIGISRLALHDILTRFNCISQNTDEDIEYILSRLGVINGKTDIDGILCKGTYEQTAEIVYNFLCKKGCDEDFETVKDEVVGAYSRNAPKGDVVPACDNIKDVLSELKSKGIRLCVVTTDNPEITQECLKKAEIEDFFERVYTDDGHTKPKPDASCIDEFCAETGVSRDRMLVVGDTVTDVNFARNAEISIVCVGNDSNRKKLERVADSVIPDISYLIDYINS